MIAVEAHAEGAIIAIRAQAGARCSGVRGEHDGALRVSVVQVAEKGRANRAIVEVLARALALRKSQIELVSGATSQHKKFLVRAISVQSLSDRIERALGEKSRE
jgi:uncharacterized protein